MAAPTKRESVVVNGFTVIPIKCTNKSTAGHNLYVKEHNVRGGDEAKPNGRTLFVLNVPPYVTQGCLEQLFSDCGKVVKVFLHSRPTSTSEPQQISPFFPIAETQSTMDFKVAYVVFKNAASVQKAKQIPFGEARILSTKEKPLPTGMKKWCQEYQTRYQDTKLLQDDIDSYMAAYDQKIKEEEAAAKSMEGVADEDGWVKVTRHSKHNKGLPYTQAHEKRLKEKHSHKTKEKELLNFYAFQIRETKREHIATLRQKFEEDKQRIALMKAARKFRPY